MDKETEALLEEHAEQQRRIMQQGIDEKERDWRELAPETLRDNMWDEVVELYKAFSEGDKARLEKAAADVSNFAMMLAWKARHSQVGDD